MPVLASEVTAAKELTDAEAQKVYNVCKMLLKFEPVSHGGNPTWFRFADSVQATKFTATATPVPALKQVR